MDRRLLDRAYEHYRKRRDVRKALAALRDELPELSAEDGAAAVEAARKLATEAEELGEAWRDGQVAEKDADAELRRRNPGFSPATCKGAAAQGRKGKR